mmetsp:Transcript_372/g.441  ORF Transcript_372/g.441 Transcript_372/m.441 type:complete len:151 (-) Transcript_372:690-1142(-)
MFHSELHQQLSLLFVLGFVCSLTSTLSAWYSIPLGPFGTLSFGIWEGRQNSRDSSTVAVEILSVLVVLSCVIGLFQTVMDSGLNLISSYATVGSVSSILCLAIFLHSHDGLKLKNFGVGFYLQVAVLALLVFISILTMKFKKRNLYSTIL